jgi:hypothetical protein
MKKVTLFFVAIAICSSLLAQEAKKDYEIQTLLGKNISHGCYLGISMGYSLIDNKNAFTAGGRLGWVINHRLVMGLAGNGFVNDVYYSESETGNEKLLNGGYGGLFLEPVIGSRLPIHVSFPVIFGVGDICYNETYYQGAEPWESSTYDEDDFAIVEPGVEVELNMLKCFRIAVGISYRYTSEIRLMNTSKDVLNGLTGSLTLKFGKF